MLRTKNGMRVRTRRLVCRILPISVTDAPEIRTDGLATEKDRFRLFDSTLLVNSALSLVESHSVRLFASRTSSAANELIASSSQKSRFHVLAKIDSTTIEALSSPQTDTAATRTTGSCGRRRVGKGELSRSKCVVPAFLAQSNSLDKPRVLEVQRFDFDGGYSAVILNLHLASDLLL